MMKSKNTSKLKYWKRNCSTQFTLPERKENNKKKFQTRPEIADCLQIELLKRKSLGILKWRCLSILRRKSLWIFLVEPSHAPAKSLPQVQINLNQHFPSNLNMLLPLQLLHQALKSKLLQKKPESSPHQQIIEQINQFN
jgi:hypothetical protein